MDELDLLIEKRYKKKNPFDSDELTHLVGEVLDRFYDSYVSAPKSQNLEEASDPNIEMTGEEFVQYLPKFAPNENWGDPSSVDRQVVDKLFSAVGGSASPEAKLAYLSRIAQPGNKITGTRRILSSLIILETLAGILDSFQPSPAGFIFEAFLSALLRGHQIPAGGGTIADLVGFSQLSKKQGSDKGIPISLKLLSPNTPIEGSYTDLINSLNKDGTMTYIVARKEGKVIKLEEFVFTRDNFLKVISTTAYSKLKKSAAELFQLPNQSPEESLQHLASLSTWEEKFAELQKTPGYRGKKTPKTDEKRPAETEEDERRPAEPQPLQEDTQLLTEGSITQWAIRPPQLANLAKELGKPFHQELGEIPYDRSIIYEVAQSKMMHLNGSLKTLFKATSELSENVNSYFMTDARATAMNAGNRAIENTGQIESNIRTEMTADEED